MRAHDLDALCARAGIERAYIDHFGQRHEVAPQTIETIADAMGLFAAAAPPATLAPVTVWRIEHGPPEIELMLPATAAPTRIVWQVLEEQGGKHAGELGFADLALAAASAPDTACRKLWLPALPLGYHRLVVACEGAGTSEALLIVVPARAYLPPRLARGAGVWGIAAQLYALRSERDWGIGDFGDLLALVRHAADGGADIIGLNPLHALDLDAPERASPYAPNSRIFLNPLYVDVEAIPDYRDGAAARRRVASPAFQAELRKARGADLVDYATVARLKRAALEQVYDSFRRRHRAAPTARGRAFREFQRSGGDMLRRFCIFQALRAARARDDASQRDWRNWPAPYRDPGSSAVAAFAARNRRKIAFFEYLQWVADDQLTACAAAAQDGGMAIGLYRDMAVGVDAGAAEAWATQDVVVGGWSIGAPPDALARNGQDWGLSPLNPVALRRAQYRPFIEIVRANMRHAGALRIDHVLGLWRSFWIRQGETAARGAYVRNPFHDLVGILALESHRARCVVIGEDLGTVPEGLRGELERAGILSYRLLYFEQDGGRFRRPRDYPRTALAAVTTHDLPMLPAYWSGADIALRSELGLLPDVRQERERRAADRAALWAALREEGLVQGGPSDAAPVEAAYRYLARTRSHIVMLHLEDALGITAQINVPGTVDQHPNWRRRWPADLDAMFREPRVRALLRAMERERPKPRGH